MSTACHSRSLFAGSVLAMLPAFVIGQDVIPAGAMQGLASENYKDRVQAQRALADWADKNPAVAVDRLFLANEEASDPEVRLRLRETLRELVVSEHQKKEGQGYVGIQMIEEVAVVLPGDPEERGGIRITWIHAGTPAESAGLQVGDLIVGLDDMKWPGGPGARAGFAEEIRRRKPGDKVDLRVLRGKRLETIGLTLRARPLGLDRAVPFVLPADGPNHLTEELKRLENEEKDAYFERWLADRRAGAKKD